MEKGAAWPDADVPDAPLSTYIKPQARRLYDTTVTLEEYHYYALRTREQQAALVAPKTSWKEIALRKKPAHDISNDGESDETKRNSITETGERRRSSVNLANREVRKTITDKEWTDASRALRTASWAGAFYLIVCDVIGPYGTPFAIGTLGWGPGIALYIVFGGLATYSGYQIWRTFLGLDSYEFPLKNYGDMALRTVGPSFRILVNIVQILSLILILGQVTIQNGQAISQISKFRLCYAVCNVVFIAAGFILNQIKTLKNYSWVANLAIWLNLLVIFISMGFISASPPNYAISKLGSAGSAVDPASIAPTGVGANRVYPPIKHTGGLPGSTVGSVNGLMSAVLAYAGAQLYCEFMAEMRRPRDFNKSIFMAMSFIITVYLVYGCFVYYYQGQYTYSVSYQGVSRYSWSVGPDVLALLSGLIAAALYGNIGIKVLYNNFFMDYFNAPPLNTKWGGIWWAILVPIWWSIAFVIAAAIPDYFGFVSVMSAATLLPLTFVFPPIIALAYNIQIQALKADPANGFDPVTGQTTRQWTGIQRWIRGYFAGGPRQILFNVWHTVYALGAISLMGLGMWAAIIGLKDAFEDPQVNAFTCTSPLNLNA